MFDQDDYVSDEQETIMYSSKNVPSSHVLAPNSGSDFNHLAGQGESLMKIMKDRGLDLTENQMKKMNQHRNKDKSQPKTKAKTGFFDGGDKATVEQLIKALNKAFSQADPQQASCILSYILEKKNLSIEDRNKFSIMKCNILFGLGAYEDCLNKAQQFLQKPYNKLSAAIFSNLMAKCKEQSNRLLCGYMDLLRAKSLLEEYKQQLGDIARNKQEQQQKQLQKLSNSTENTMSQKVDKKQKQKKQDDYTESEVDTTTREINHTEMEYNIKMSKFKNSTNLIYPYFNQFRHRKILQVVCGDFHTLFLLNGALGTKEEDGDGAWATEVFGLGENTVGQITGRERKVIYKEPVLISQLSGKNIRGIWASRQSSLAYDNCGNIYEWGIKQTRNELIEVTYSVGQEIIKLEKGYKHYALLTKSGKFYSWGNIEMKNMSIYNQAKPQMQDSKNIVSFSCGSNHTIAVDSSGYIYSLGSNQFFQLGMPAEKLTKTFKKVQNNMIGDIKKVFCISDCTFVINSDNEVFFCGKYSLKKQVQQKFRQAQFGDDFKDIILISGSVGTYYVTNQSGNCYKWDVDTMVKFKLDKQNEQITQRYVEACRGTVLRVRSLVSPQHCQAVRVTQQLRTYEPINYLITLQDSLGLYGVPDFIIPPKCQIFMSTYKAKKQQLLNENKLFTEGHNFCTTSNKILLNQIIQNRLLEYQMSRDEEEPWIAKLKISVDVSGRYYFYIILEDTLILEQQLEIQVSERQKQLEAKNKQEKLLKEQERRRKAELERQRLAEQKLRRQQEEEQKRKQTQKRAEQALKKHLRQQQEAKLREEQQRKARKDLMTGGGFDLTKLKKKSSGQLISPTTNPLSATMTEKIQKIEKIQRMERTGQSFLPDINQRPSSRKKVLLPKPSELVGGLGTLGKQKPVPLLKSSVTDFSSTGYSIKDKQQSNPAKERLGTPKQRQTILTTVSSTNTGVIKTSQPKAGTGIVKRGLSNKKK